jgi:hypothetical protein
MKVCPTNKGQTFIFAKREEKNWNENSSFQFDKLKKEYQSNQASI